MNMRLEDFERFLECIRSYPFLYDKTHCDYKDTDGKTNRWELIGREFGLTASEASSKFRNARDRWLKIVSGTDATCRSGAPGDAAKKWALFPLIDGMLRSTPHYARRTTTNIPNKTGQSPGPSQPSCSRFATPERYDDTVVNSHDDDSTPAPAQTGLSGSCSPSPAQNRGPPSLNLAPVEIGPLGQYTPPARLSKGTPAGGPPSRRRKRRDDNFEDCVKAALVKCAGSLASITGKQRNEVECDDDSAATGRLVTVKLRALPPRQRSQAIFNISKILYEAEQDSL
ncbi:uncharacterized protein [Dermacentor albipictus]|uniref:uncharacterized protein n=1 Tax=Dermacentor albipictus TaxID=60249 RepID=UPI0031FCF829